MTTGRDDLHVLLGAYVLGGLSDDDHRAFTEHLRTCAQCQAELGQVSGLPRLLDLAGPEGGPHLVDSTGPTQPASVPVDDGRVGDLLAELSRRRRRRRVWLTGVTSAAAAAVFVGGARIGPDLLTASPPTTHYVASAAPGSGTSGRVDVALVTRGWGTQVDLDCEDMPTDGTLVLYLIDEEGHGVAAASWRATRSGYSRVTGATALRPNEIRAVEVRTGSGEVVASTPT